MNQKQRRFISIATVAAAMAVGAPAHGASASEVFAESAASFRPTAAQRAEVEQRYRLVKRIVEGIAPEAQRMGLAAGWRQSTTVMLLGLSSTQLAGIARLGTYGAVINAAAKPGTKALGDAGDDLVFKPFVPCRYMDTRGAGGKISGIRTFDLANSGPVYGGDAGCDPKTLAGVANEDAIGALAVNIALVDTSSGAPGFLTMRPAGSTQLTALANWYVASASAQDSNAAVVAIDQTAQADEIEIMTSGPVHVIVDLLGVFISPHATALDCATVTSPPGSSTTGDLLPGESDIFTAACATGYTITGGGCAYFTTSQTAPAATDNKVLMNRSQRTFDTASQTFLNSWTCHMTNTDTMVTWRMQTRAVCCRVPGR